MGGIFEGFCKGTEEEGSGKVGGEGRGSLSIGKLRVIFVPVVTAFDFDLGGPPNSSAAPLLSSPITIITMEQNIDLTKLSDTDKKELNQVLTNEAQKSNIQQSEFPPRTT